MWVSAKLTCPGSTGIPFEMILLAFASSTPQPEQENFMIVHTKGFKQPSYFQLAL